MAKDYPPDAWDVETGTWGTDVDHDDTTTYIKTGDSSLKMILLNTGTTVEMLSEFVPVEGDADYLITWIGYPDNASASSGNNVKVQAVWYDKDQAELGAGSPTTLINDYPRGTGITQTLHRWGDITSAPTGARWMRLRVSGVSTNQTWNMYYDSIQAFKQPLSIGMSIASDQSISASTWTDLDFDTVDWSSGITIGATTGGDGISTKTGGRWVIYAHTTLGNLDVDSYATMQIRVTDSNGTGEIQGSSLWRSASGGGSPRLTASGIYDAVQGNYTTSELIIRARVWHNSAGAQNALASSSALTAYLLGT